MYLLTKGDVIEFNNLTLSHGNCGLLNGIRKIIGECRRSFLLLQLQWLSVNNMKKS